MNSAKTAVQTKATQVRDDVTGKVNSAKTAVQTKAEEVRREAEEVAGKVKDGVKTGAEMTVGAGILVGRLGKNAVIKGVKTAEGAYKATKSATEKAKEGVEGWFKARGKDISKAKEAVQTKASQVRDDVTGKVNNARDVVALRATTKLQDFFQSRSNFYKQLNDRLEPVAVSLRDRQEQAKIERETAKKETAKTNRDDLEEQK